MSPQSLYSNYAEETKEESRKLLSIITENVPEEKIFLLGQTNIQRTTITLFTKQSVPVNCPAGTSPF